MQALSTQKSVSPDRIVLLGYGAIGQVVARLLRTRVPDWPLAVWQRQTQALPGLTSFTEWAQVKAWGPSLVVECAGQTALDQWGRTVLGSGCDLMLVSVGALADAERLKGMSAAAAEGGSRLLIPAGALGGIDWLSTSAWLPAADTRVLLRSTKPARAWRGTPAQESHDLDALNEATVVFEGSAREAAQRFPANANIAATLGLATIGLDAVRVQLVADPQAQRNSHEIEAHTPMGEMHLRMHNMPDPDQPRTSRVTAFSVAQAIERRSARLVIGS